MSDHLDWIHVAIALHSVVVWRPDERVEHLVLARVVTTGDETGEQARTEESWTSSHRSVFSALGRIDALRPVVEDLLLGRPIDTPADMSRLEDVDAARLEALLEPGRWKNC